MKNVLFTWIICIILDLIILFSPLIILKFIVNVQINSNEAFGAILIGMLLLVFLGMTPKDDKDEK